MLDLIVEGFGYLATVLLALSLLMDNDLKFRWFNTGGNISFITYGIFIGAIPIIATNSILLLINTYRLWKLYSTPEDFDLIEVKESDKIIHKFLAYHKADIQEYFPDYSPNEKKGQIAFIVLRNMVIANYFVAGINQKDVGIVHINYTVPKYRDYKVGRFIFEKEKKYLLLKGINKLVYIQVLNKNHEEFLQEMGFTRQEYEGQSLYLKEL